MFNDLRSDSMALGLPMVSFPDRQGRVYEIANLSYDCTVMVFIVRALRVMLSKSNVILIA